jgi:DNA polymerase V
MSDQLPANMPDKALPPLMSDAVAAGFPSPAEQYVEGPLDLNELLVHRPAATFFVRAVGDSMIGVGIHPGDILVVDRSLEAVDRAVVIAAVNGELTVKLLRRDQRGVRLEAANPAYRPIVLLDDMDTRIFGVVTALIHQFVRT